MLGLAAEPESHCVAPGLEWKLTDFLPPQEPQVGFVVCGEVDRVEHIRAHINRLPGRLVDANSRAGPGSGLARIQNAYRATLGHIEPILGLAFFLLGEVRDPVARPRAGLSSPGHTTTDADSSWTGPAAPPRPRWSGPRPPAAKQSAEQGPLRRIQSELVISCCDNPR